MVPEAKVPKEIIGRRIVKDSRRNQVADEVLVKWQDKGEEENS